MPDAPEATNPQPVTLTEEQAEILLKAQLHNLAKKIQQGKTAQQAHDQAWEMVREKYILLPPES